MGLPIWRNPDEKPSSQRSSTAKPDPTAHARSPLRRRSHGRGTPRPRLQRDSTSREPRSPTSATSASQWFERARRGEYPFSWPSFEAAQQRYVPDNVFNSTPAHAERQAEAEQSAYTLRNLIPPASASSLNPFRRSANQPWPEWAMSDMERSALPRQRMQGPSGDDAPSGSGAGSRSIFTTGPGHHTTASQQSENPQLRDSLGVSISRRPTDRAAHPLRNSWHPDSPVDGLGDRDRSPTPTDAWEVIRATIPPDENLPSADSSFASAAAARQSFTAPVDSSESRNPGLLPGRVDGIDHMNLSASLMGNLTDGPLVITPQSLDNHSAGQHDTTETSSVSSAEHDHHTSDSDTGGDSTSSIDPLDACAIEEPPGCRIFAQEMYQLESVSPDGPRRILYHTQISQREGFRFAAETAPVIVEIGYRLIGDALQTSAGIERVQRMYNRLPRSRQGFRALLCMFDIPITARIAHLFPGVSAISADDLVQLLFESPPSTDSPVIPYPPPISPRLPAAAPVVAAGGTPSTNFPRPVDGPAPAPASRIAPPGVLSDEEGGSSALSEQQRLRISERQASEALLTGDIQDLDSMRRIIERLAARDDVPEEWWMSMGLNLSSARPRRLGAAMPANRVLAAGDRAQEGRITRRPVRS